MNLLEAYPDTFPIRWESIPQWMVSHHPLQITSPSPHLPQHKPQGRPGKPVLDRDTGQIYPNTSQCCRALKMPYNTVQSQLAAPSKFRRFHFCLSESEKVELLQAYQKKGK